MRSFKLIPILRRWDVIVALVIVIAGIVIKWQSTWMPENVVIPTPRMPSPNAFDSIGEAALLMRDKSVVSMAISAPGDASHATKAQLADFTGGYHVFTLTEKQHLIAENQPALDKLHEAFRYPYLAPPARSFDAMFPYYPHDRLLARLLLLEAKVDEQTGDWTGAINARLDALQLGEELAHGAPLIGMLVGVACQGIGREGGGISRLIAHLPAADARSAALRLDQIDRDEVTVSQTIREEEWGTQTGLLDLVKRSRNWRAAILSESEGDNQNQLAWTQNATGAIAWTPMAVESPRTAFRNYTSYLDQTVEFNHLPWPKQITQAAPKVPTDPVNSLLCPVFSRASFMDLTSLALDRMLEVQLALRSYDADHGAYPESLSALAPTFLPSVPVDPFSDNQPLKYRLVGARYILYSIGPDAIDDGGKAMCNPQSGSAQYFVRDPSAKGDIVAGVNY